MAGLSEGAGSCTEPTSGTGEGREGVGMGPVLFACPDRSPLPGYRPKTG